MLCSITDGPQEPALDWREEEQAKIDQRVKDRKEDLLHSWKYDPEDFDCHHQLTVEMLEDVDFQKALQTQDPAIIGLEFIGFQDRFIQELAEHQVRNES